MTSLGSGEADSQQRGNCRPYSARGQGDGANAQLDCLSPPESTVPRPGPTPRNPHGVQWLLSLAAGSSSTLASDLSPPLCRVTARTWGLCACSRHVRMRESARRTGKGVGDCGGCEPDSLVLALFRFHRHLSFASFVPSSPAQRGVVSYRAARRGRLLSRLAGLLLQGALEDPDGATD